MSAPMDIDKYWPEIDDVKNGHKHELVVTGKDIEERLKKTDGLLPGAIYNLRKLNFLEISSCGLGMLSESLSKMEELTKVVLHRNCLVGLPDSLGNLKNLKHLDLSYNQLVILPDTLSELTNLLVINCAHNELMALPSLAKSINLVHVDLSYNQICTFPTDAICDSQLLHLSEVILRNNQIESVPGEISKLAGSLKKLDLAENKIVLVCGELGDCSKLKDLNLLKNPLKDRRLYKLVEEYQRNHKAMMDYIRKTCVKTTDGGNNASKKGNKLKNKKPDKRTARDSESDLRAFDQIIVERSDEFLITVTQKVLPIRQYLICCLVKGVDLRDGRMKKFVQLQTKLHDTVCKKRQSATMATHDFSLVKFPLTYSVKNPDKMKIIPLGKSDAVPVRELVRGLMEEADLARKESKRNKFTGIHQYLYLLKGWSNFPCLVDADNDVISFPPITNSDKTKISEQTKDIFLEVSSSENLQSAKAAIEALLYGMLSLNLCSPSKYKGEYELSFPTVEEVKIEEQTVAAVVPVVGDSGDLVPEEDGQKRLNVCQVRTVSEDGSMRVVFPSKNDMTSFEGVEVVDLNN